MLCRFKIQYYVNFTVTEIKHFLFSLLEPKKPEGEKGKKKRKKKGKEAEMPTKPTVEPPKIDEHDVEVKTPTKLSPEPSDQQEFDSPSQQATQKKSTVDYFSYAMLFSSSILTLKL